MRRFFLLVLVGAALLQGSDSILAVRSRELEEIAVYSAVVEQKFVREWAEGAREPVPEGLLQRFVVVINGRTRLGFVDHGADPIQSISKRREEWRDLAPADLFDDFASRNVKGSTVRDEFRLSLRHVVLSESEYQGIFGSADKGWRRFFEKYPDAVGIVTFSGVGFNSSMTHALVYVEYHCIPLCGEGTYVLLRRKGGTWVVEGESGVWIS